MKVLAREGQNFHSNFRRHVFRLMAVTRFTTGTYVYGLTVDPVLRLTALVTDMAAKKTKGCKKKSRHGGKKKTNAWWQNKVTMVANKSKAPST